MAVTVTVFCADVLLVSRNDVVLLLNDSLMMDPAELDAVVAVMAEPSVVWLPVAEVEAVCEPEVIVCWDDSAVLPLAALLVPETPANVTDTDAEAPADTATTVADVPAVTSVSFEVEVPSLTLISTTLAVTVASGALGRR